MDPDEHYVVGHIEKKGHNICLQCHALPGLFPSAEVYSPCSFLQPNHNPTSQGHQWCSILSVPLTGEAFNIYRLFSKWPPLFPAIFLWPTYYFQRLYDSPPLSFSHNPHIHYILLTPHHLKITHTAHNDKVQSKHRRLYAEPQTLWRQSSSLGSVGSPAAQRRLPRSTESYLS